MPKLPPLKPGAVIAALERAGFRQVRQRGNLLVTVPSHPRDLHPHVLRSIIRQAQMTVEEFLDVL